MSNNGWIKHDGLCVPEEILGKTIIKKYRDGSVIKCHEVDNGDLTFIWPLNHSTFCPEDDVIAYKVVS